MKGDLAAKIHRGIYGKSDKLNAAENDNPDFKSGFDDGNKSDHKSEIHPEWFVEFERRGGNECDWQKWREWKRGWHAARLQRTLLQQKSPAQP